MGNNNVNIDKIYDDILFCMKTVSGNYVNTTIRYGTELHNLVMLNGIETVEKYFNDFNDQFNISIFDGGINGIKIKKITVNINDMVECVKNFMLASNQPYTENETILEQDRLDFRLNLIQEEFDELIEESAIRNTKGERDAVGDLLYVIIGYAHERGFGSKIQNDFMKIHESNMSKFCKTEEEAIETVENYTKNSVETYYKKNPNTNLYVVYRKSDNKVLKSINYTPVDLS
jgi:SpoVK/Ycf46/Vps4 family AAA+-type ATPase